MKAFTGKVVGVKMAKTATVELESWVKHPVYGKRIKRTKKYQVHDEFGTSVGDKVRFVVTRPISKTKRWKIIEVIGKEDTTLRKATRGK